MRSTVIRKKRVGNRVGLKSFEQDHPPLAFSIPATAHNLEGFRRWSCSDDFPQHGEIFFLAGEIWIDMSPERLNSHNKVKTELTRVGSTIVVNDDLGEFFSDRTRLVHPGADLSVKPDALFVSWASYEAGLVRLIPTADEKDFIELEGTPDWVAEILSPSSEKKDTDTLMRLYHLARIPEYWLIDARGTKTRFFLFVWEPDGYRPIEAKGGWYPSTVFGKSFRWRRKKNRINQWTYFLEMR